MSKANSTPRRGAAPPVAMILGLNEIASAVAVELHDAGYAVAMSHDPNPPVIRRGMAFFDALYHDPVCLGGIGAVCVEDTLSLRAHLAARESIVVTQLGPLELFTLGGIKVLIDARMQKHTITPDLRNLAPIAVGLGPGFTVGRNCDLAIETKPGEEGKTLRRGQTLAADGVSRNLGGLGRERFIYSDIAGHWRTALDVGARVFKGFPLGLLGDRTLAAPFDGILRGIARDGIDVVANVKLIEIDPRGRAAQWTGIDQRGAAIAHATRRAVIELSAARSLRPKAGVLH